MHHTLRIISTYPTRSSLPPHLPLPAMSPFNTPNDSMTITVSGGSLEENQQLCSALRASLQRSGFKQVDIQIGSEFRAPGVHDGNVIACVHAYNPDLLDTPIVVEGESNDDVSQLFMGSAPSWESSRY